MNWFKQAQKVDSEYFTELFGKNVLNQQILENINDHFKIQSFIGCGDDGCAYRLQNNLVLKITSNPKEAKVYFYLMEQNVPHTVNVIQIQREGQLFYVVKEWIPDAPTNIKSIIQKIETYLDARKCYNPFCALKILQTKAYPLKNQIESYLKAIQGVPVYDFLNANNVGWKNGQIVFFDIS